MTAGPSGEASSQPLSVPLARWQRFQDQFAHVLGFGLRTIGPDRALLTDPSWPSWLDPVRVAGLFRLGEELESLLPSDALPQDIRFVSRPVGVSFAAIPLRDVEERVTACLVAGPVILGRRENLDGFKDRMRALGLDPEPLWPILLTLRLYSFAGLRSALQLVEEVGALLIELAALSQHPSLSRIDERLAKDYTDRLLRALLDAATAATEADGGSIMVYDQAKQAFQITVAEGLGQDVVSSVRPGEGLAEIAAAERAILLLDDQTQDERLRSRMMRRELASSLVGPVLAGSTQELLGVLNLRTADPRRCFKRGHVEVLRRLLHLAGVALSSLQYTGRSQARPSKPS